MIQVDHLTFNYGRRSKVLTDITLRLPEGHIHGLLGCNGVGKSTLLKLLCGLLYPTSGSIDVDGFAPKERPVALFRQLAFLPEELDLPALSIQCYATVNAPFYPHFSMEAFKAYCLDLEVDATRSLHKLSMGQRKKAYLAFLLACNAKILLLDEPTNGLDIPSKGIFRRLMAAYATEDRTIIISTHQVKDIENLIDNVIICDQQGVIINASTEELTRHFCFGEVDADAIYTEAGIGGSIGVRENKSGEESRINLELLFNAATRERAKMQAILHAKTNDYVQ
ncbi:MAG: ABC transporter ATP-binding protein [Alistipes sp.]